MKWNCKLTTEAGPGRGHTQPYPCMHPSMYRSSHTAWGKNQWQGIIQNRCNYNFQAELRTASKRGWLLSNYVKFTWLYTHRQTHKPTNKHPHTNTVISIGRASKVLFVKHIHCRHHCFILNYRQYHIQLKSAGGIRTATKSTYNVQIELHFEQVTVKDISLESNKVKLKLSWVKCHGEIESITR